MGISSDSQVGHWTRFLFQGSVSDKTCSSLTEACQPTPSYKGFFIRDNKVPSLLLIKPNVGLYVYYFITLHRSQTVHRKHTCRLKLTRCDINYWRTNKWQVFGAVMMVLKDKNGAQKMQRILYFIPIQFIFPYLLFIYH